MALTASSGCGGATAGSGSVVTVQLGQCGNQIGEALFANIWEEANAAPSSLSAFKHSALARFFRQPDDASLATTDDPWCLPTYHSLISLPIPSLLDVHSLAQPAVAVLDCWTALHGRLS